MGQGGGPVVHKALASMPAYPAPSYRRRAASILLVSGLHAALLFALLHFMVQPQTGPAPMAERLLEMIIRPQAIVAPSLPPPRQWAQVPRVQRQGPVAAPAPSLAPPAQAPDIRALGRALTGCAPENLSNLSPDERAHCPDALHKPDDSVLAMQRSHVKDPARRAAEMAAKNGQPRIACTSIKEFKTPAGSVAVPMLDPGCAVKGAVNGFEPLNGLSK
jgi:hypothetical protein